jgi:hypothetical protein
LTSATRETSYHERQATPSTTVLFMHIPKTAGTSMRRMLESVYDKEDVAYLYDPHDWPTAILPQNFAGVPIEQRSRMRLVVGHFPYGIHRLLPGPSTYVTVLRDPMDRLISLYHHNRLRATGPLRESLDAGMTLEEFVLSGRIMQSDNEMVRQIAGPPNVPFGQCNEALMHDAMANLTRRFGSVIIFEDMEPGLRRLASLIGCDNLEPPRENTTAARELVDEVDSQVRERILRLNRYDEELYRWARHRAASDA